ncbi:MAG: GNAT family N-acetyltransferase [Ktedonobacteraceae bacterium]|nr:GNAT family N-acetyltransferase [Ktedonobacteraceae bacterium]
MHDILPPGFIMRPAALEDAAALTNLIAERDSMEYPPELDYQPDYTVEDIEAECHSLNLATDTCAVFAPDGQLAGYLGVTTDFVDVQRAQPYVGIQSFSGVHPAFVGLGIGTELLRFAHTWAREQHRARSLRITTWINPRNERARRLVAKEGYTSDQHGVVEMKVKLSQEPPPIEWPAGIRVRSFRPGQDDVLVKAAIEEAFGLPFTHWEQVYTQRTNFDPTLWHLAWDGEQVAGVLIGVPNPDMGWIDQLGVRPAWRKRGIGQALLRHAIRDFYQRGLHTVALSVAINNQHGAPRLYARAGMQVGSQIDRYSKPV